MSLRVPADPEQLDSIHVETRDRDRVVEALRREAADCGLCSLDPADLAPFGRWLHGDEDPAVRRHLVSPPGARWTTLLCSMTDWDRELLRGLSERLDARAVSLMLHDGDVLSVAACDGPTLLVDHVTSPDHFDLPPRAPGELDADVAALLACCRPGTTEDDIRESLTLPGPIDVDGRAAFLALAQHLEIEPSRALGSYRLALDDDELTPRAAYSDWLHLAFRESARDDLHDEAPGERSDERGRPSEPSQDGGKLLHFPGPRGSGTR